MSTIGPGAVRDVEVGDAVSVTYDPQQPSRVYLTAYAGTGAVLSAALGVLLGAGGLCFCLRRLLRRPRRPAPAQVIDPA